MSNFQSCGMIVSIECDAIRRPKIIRNSDKHLFTSGMDNRSSPTRNDRSSQQRERERDWLTDRLTDWQTDWLTDSLTERQQKMKQKAEAHNRKQKLTRDSSSWRQTADSSALRSGPISELGCLKEPIGKSGRFGTSGSTFGHQGTWPWFEPFSD